VDLAAKLEFAFVNGFASFMHEWDGWKYQYDMTTLTQRSPGQLKTERPLRRVRYSSAR
jgi:hypothetical protein